MVDKKHYIAITMSSEEECAQIADFLDKHGFRVT